jgi:hypothetical protein
VSQDTEYVEVDVDNTGAEDEVAETTPTETTPAQETKAKRSKLPDGYITPIQFNNLLQQKLREQGKLGENEEHRPQVIYSYINNRGKNSPFPVVFVDEAGNEYEEKGEGRRPALRVDESGTPTEGLAWWDDKENRKVTRKENAATKAAKKAEKPQAAAAGAQPTQTVSDADLATVEEVE